MEELTRKQKRVLLLLLLAALLGAGLLLMRSAKRGLVEVIPIEAITGSFRDRDTKNQGSENMVTVHLCGAVNNPGVYILPYGARLYEAVEAAGGALEEADIHLLNLASLVKDGERINIPTVWKGSSSGEKAPAVAAPQSPIADRPSVSGARTESVRSEGARLTDLNSVGIEPVRAEGTRLIDPNTASHRELQTIPGIGPVLAERIIEHREKVGRFENLGDLKKVKGIGDKTLEKIRGYLDLRP